jgi:uncharacterized membrane protein
MTRFEIYRWVRSKRLLVVVAAFTFSGLTAPLASAYADEIFGAVSTADNVQVTLAKATWQDAISSYLQNSSQLALIFACYLAAWGCSLGADERLRTFYRSRARRSSEIFGARLAVSAVCIWLATLVGAGLALYTTIVLFDDIVVSEALPVLALHSIGVVAVSMLAACLAVVTNAPALSAGVIYGVALVGDFVRSAEFVSRWSPTVLLRPTELLQGGQLSNYWRPLAVVGVLLLGAVTAILVRRVRRLSRPPANGARGITGPQRVERATELAERGGKL